MTCKRCRKRFPEDESRCPHCGHPNPDPTRLYQTSTVMISSGGADLVYRSVDEVPVRLRTKLLRFTNGRNSATILIADRRGRREIAKVMRSLPAPAHRKLAGAAIAAVPRWLTHRRKLAILAALVLLVLTVLSVLILHQY